MNGRLTDNPVLASGKRSREAFNKMVAKQQMNEKMLKNKLMRGI